MLTIQIGGALCSTFNDGLAAYTLDQYVGDVATSELQTVAIQFPLHRALREHQRHRRLQHLPDRPQRRVLPLRPARWASPNFGNDNYLAYLDGAQYYKLNASIVGMRITPDGGGYWMVGSDGGVFSSGDAGFFGSTGGLHLNKPVVGIAATPDGGGYWFVASDGGIFAYGDAQFYGSNGRPTQQADRGDDRDPIGTGIGWSLLTVGSSPLATPSSTGRPGAQLNKPWSPCRPPPMAMGIGWSPATVGSSPSATHRSLVLRPTST